MIKNTFLLVVCFCLFSSVARTDDIYGLMMVVKGDVEVIAKDKKETKAHIGIKIYPGDTIITKKDARAKVVMVDKNVINISPDSKLMIEKYEYNPEADKKGALINVIYGKLRTTVNQKYDGEKNTFRIKTQTAVAGVRGTDFMVSYSEATNSSKVVTFRGRVEVGSGLDSTGHIQGAVFVTPGNFTMAAAHQAPTQPTAVPPQELATMKEQSLAESPHSAGDSREPSSKESGKSNNSNGNNGNMPANGNSGSISAPQSSTLSEMGEDVAAPAASAPPPIPPKLPVLPTTSAGNTCTGACVPGQVDPNLLKGISKVIVNLQP